MSETFGTTWRDSVDYMEGVIRRLHADEIRKGETLPERTFELAECYRRCDGHLYTAFLYARLSKGMNEAGVLACLAMVMVHIEAAAKLLSGGLDEPTMEMLWQRDEAIPKSPISGVIEEFHRRVQHSLAMLRKSVSVGDMQSAAMIKTSQDHAERAATLLGDEVMLAAATEQKGSIYTQAAAEKVFGPDAELDSKTRLVKLLCAANFSKSEMEEMLEEMARKK